MMQIGFIGLGNLGTALAENILSQHQPLYIYNRTKSKALPLADKGAVICDSVKELSAKCDVVFSIVSDDAALTEITEGTEGIAANLRQGGIHLSLSTVLPATSATLLQLHKQYGNEYLASPVMGRPEAVRARKINFFVSGDSASIQTVKPLLEYAGAAGVWEFGDEVGAANVAKLCSNYLVFTTMQALAESINLAKGSSLDAEKWLGVLTQTYFNAPIYHTYSQILLQEKFHPASFSLRLGMKDMNLILEQAQKAEANMPVGEQIQKLFQQSLANGLGEHDITAIALAIKNSHSAVAKEE